MYLVRFIVLAVFLCAAVTGCANYDESQSSSTGETPSYGYYGDESDYETRQADWEAQTGENWDLFNEAYSVGWDEGCKEAFSGSPDGYLYDQDEEFSADDCVATNPGDASVSADLPYDVPDDPETAGEELGMTDGCISAFEELPVDGGGALYYGDEAFDESVCP